MKLRDLKALEWDDRQSNLRLLDQRLLPSQEKWLQCTTAEDVAVAIRDMAIRGAPAIGVAAAYGMVLAAQANAELRGHSYDELVKAHDLLAATRPTAVNLFWALEQCARLAREDGSPAKMLALAKRIHEEDIDGNLRMGETGAKHVENGMSILTHCNAGALATGGVGTALGVIFVAQSQGKKIHVYVDETRPRLQGARLTTWELSKMGVPHTMICDNMAASLMAKGKIQLCVTGADRIAANGDAANKIGTYSVAVNAHHHKVPFYVAAPRSTFDLTIAEGDRIPIEERAESEVHAWADERTCSTTTKIYNPSFDVTPASLIAGIFTDRGEIAPVTRANVQKIMAD